MSRLTLAVSVLAEAAPALIVRQPAIVVASALCVLLVCVGYTYSKPVLGYASYAASYYPLSLTLGLTVPQAYAFALAAILLVGLAERFSFECATQGGLQKTTGVDRETMLDTQKLAKNHLRLLLAASAASLACIAVSTLFSRTALNSRDGALLVFVCATALLVVLRLVVGKAAQQKQEAQKAAPNQIYIEPAQ